jgi:hypothetical protein
LVIISRGSETGAENSYQSLTLIRPNPSVIQKKKSVDSTDHLKSERKIFYSANSHEITADGILRYET